MPTGIKSPRHRRKLLAAYHAARAEYFQAIATVMGSGVLILDTHDADSKPNPSASVVALALRHEICV